MDARQPGLHASTGEAFLHGGKLQDAESEFHLELQLDSANEPAWLGLAEAALAQRQADAALKNVAKAWEVSPELLAVHREFPTIELAQDTAKALIEKLQALSSDEAPLHFLLASLYAPTNENLQSDGQWKAFNAGVLAWKERSRSSHPADMEQEACKAHRYSECVAFLQRVQPLNNSQRLLLGKLQFDLRDYQSATDSLAKVTGVNGENAEADYWLALTYHWLGAESYARLEESFPDSWRAHQLRGEGYALRKDLDNALKEFQIAVQLRPDASELHEAIAEVFLDKHSEEDAQSELEKTLALDASRTRALYLLGRLYVQKRENEKALPYLQHAVRLQPDLTEAASLLGTTYV